MATLTRKHFIGIADALHYATQELTETQRAEIVRAIADELRLHNPQFSRDRFIDRVEVGPNR